MDLKELRIDNLIFDDLDQSSMVCTLAKNTIEVTYGGKSWSTVFKPKPIPITEEWLLKFGFECWGLKKPNEYEHETTYALYNSIEGTSTFMVCLNESWYGGSTVKQWIVKIDYNSIYVHDMDYVHQLQNLYFALTGTELAIQ